MAQRFRMLFIILQPMAPVEIVGWKKTISERCWEHIRTKRPPSPRRLEALVLRLKREIFLYIPLFRTSDCGSEPGNELNDPRGKAAFQPGLDSGQQPR